MTAALTATIFPLGLLLSAVVVVVRLMKVPLLTPAIASYVELFRATPALMHLFYIFFVLPFLGIRLPPFPATVLALTLTFGAYNSEIIRAAILSVPRGQWDAARVLGMSRGLTLRRVVLPQALTILVPPLTNSLIELIKNTSLASLVSVHELLFVGQQKIAETYRTVEIFGIVTVMYFAMSYPISLFARWFEQRTRILR